MSRETVMYGFNVQVKDNFATAVQRVTEALKTGQSRLSFHLKVLKDAGLITDRPDGRWVHYSLNTDALKELEDIVRSLRDLSPRRGPAAKCC